MVKLWLLLAHQCVELTLRLIGFWLHPWLMGCCVRSLSESYPVDKNLIQWALMSVYIKLLGVSFVEIIRWWLVVIWSHILSILFLGPLGWGSSAGPGQPLPVISQGLPGRSHRVIYFWVPLMARISLPVFNYHTYMCCTRRPMGEAMLWWKDDSHYYQVWDRSEKELLPPLITFSCW